MFLLQEQRHHIGPAAVFNEHRTHPAAVFGLAAQGLHGVLCCRCIQAARVIVRVAAVVHSQGDLHVRREIERPIGGVGDEFVDADARVHVAGARVQLHLADQLPVRSGQVGHFLGHPLGDALGGVSKKLDSSIGMSGAVIFVMLVATAVTFPIQIFVLNPADLGYLQTIVFILVIAVLVQFIEIFLKKYVVALYNSLGVYLPLITTNCCVLAVTILVVDDYGADVATLGFAAAYIEALVCAVGAGVGFMLAMVMFSGVRKRVEACDPPAPFKGLPITLIAAAITSLSFMGFGGLVENLFNVTL